jgi:hypothetical protein
VSAQFDREVKATAAEGQAALQAWEINAWEIN